MHRFAIVIFLMVLFCAVASSFSATIHVPSQQPTIQAGINAAVNGDTVLVAPGVYYEGLSFQGKDILVKGSYGLNWTVVRPLGANNSIATFSQAESRAARLTGFTFSGNTGSAAAVRVDGASPTIDSCYFYNLTSSYVGGVSVQTGGPRITRNIFTQNTLWGVIYAEPGASNVAIINNTIDGVGTTARGLYVYGDYDTAYNNIVVNCTLLGFHNNGNATSQIGFNDIWNNNSNYCCGGSVPVTDLSINPSFTDAQSFDYSLTTSSPLIDAGNPDGQFNDNDGTRGDVGAIPRRVAPITIHVPGDFSNIQAAVSASINGDTVLLAPGTYVGTGNNNISVDGKHILITGTGDPALTVVNCSGAAYRTNSGFTFANIDYTTVLANFTIRNASTAVTSDENIPNLLNMTINDCTVGVSADFPLQSPLLDGITFSGNNQALSLWEGEVPVIVRNSVFRDNLCGIWARSGLVECNNSVFLDNARGLETYHYGNRTRCLLDSCLFDSNTVALSGCFTLTNSAISNSVTAVNCPFFNECSLDNVEITGTTGIIVSGEGLTLQPKIPDGHDEAVGGGVYWGAISLASCKISNNPGAIMWVTGADVNMQSVGIENCIMDNNGGGISVRGRPTYLRMINSSYTRNGLPFEISYENPASGNTINITISGCTFAANDSDGLFLDINDGTGVFDSCIAIGGNLICGNRGAGIRVENAPPDSGFNGVPTCCNTFGNLGGNYVGISDPTGNSGNLTLEPFLCDTANGDFHIAAESPCAPANNSCNQQIGAFGVACSVKPGVTAVGMENEALTNVLSPTPKIQWAVSQPVPSPQDSFIIAVGTDNDWQFAEKWNPAPFASSDTFVTYDGSALLDGQTYYLRLRVHNTLAWSDWYQTSFRMNSVPTSPTLRAPTNLAVVGSTPTLWVTNGTDAESDPLTYEFAGFHDTDCVAGPDIDLIGVASGVDSTGGQIVDPLAENCRYWWMARAFDGYEYSDWTAYAQFLVNGTPEAPAAPMLDYPPLPDNKPIFTLLPTLDWQVSHDPDPGDTVRYKLELSDRANFSFALVRDSLLNTDLPLIDSLEFGTHYYWRVTAKDKSGLSAMSSVKEFWTWKLGDMNHSHSTDLSDLSLLIAYLTQTPRPDISPKMVADLTGDCRIDLSDLSVMVAFMTTSGVVLNVGCE